MAQRSKRAAWARLGFGASLVALTTAFAAGAAEAQASPAPQQADQAKPADAGPQATPDSRDVVVISGYRESLQAAIDVKRNADVMVDAINAEDIANFPDANLAESIQRLPGVSINRENGEGKDITVRGLGSDFTRVRLNGLETLSTTAASDSGTNPNRGRGFDFNTFASDLFQSLQVRKTASAETDEGSLGATVDLVTGHPLDYNKRQLALSVQEAYYENGESWNPRAAGLYADQFFDNTVGISLSAAYNKRDSENDRYRNQPGSFDYAYRGSVFATSPAPANNSFIINRAGFAAPTGTLCSGPDGVVPGQTITNAIACAAMSGSAPTAYGIVNSPRGQTITDTNPGTGVTSTTTAGGALTLIPALFNIEEQDLSQERLGLTGSFQWRPQKSTELSLDLVYSHFEQGSEVNQIQSVGLNRNNTNSNYNTATGATTVATKRGTYQACTDQAAIPFRDPINCGGSQGMPGGVYSGFGTTSFSTNPNNLDPYDYYNNPLSPGYGGATAVAAANGMYFRDAFIGRPATRLIDAHVDATGAADYLAFNNADWRSATDASYFTTTFQQASLNFHQDITDALRMDLVYGKSRSLNDNDGQLVEFNRMDSQGTTTWDARGGGKMPEIDYGFNVADPASWTLVKGFSTLRHFVRSTDNRFETLKADFDLDLGDGLALEFGVGKRKYRFDTNAAQRLSNEAVNPTLAELNVPITALGRVYQFGQGMDVPGKTPSAFFAPNIEAFRQIIGFDCNCVNKYGDWTLSKFSNPQNQFGVRENDTSLYLQLDWDTDLWGHRFNGNIGSREARTDVTANGFTTNVAATGPRPISEENKYTDSLPSMNASFEVTQDLLLRFGAAKVMARPLLANLAPSITAISVPTASGATSGGTMTIGNPFLSPFKSTNYDFSVEWYFAKGGLLSLAVFSKDISNVPQTVIVDAPLSSLLDPDSIQGLLQTQTNANSQQYILTDQPFNVRTFRDAPGGTIDGWELSYQQDFTFLPGIWSNTGVQANYTHIDSKLHYIVDPGSTVTPIRPQVIQDGPWQGASPDAFNVTAYYQDDMFNLRLSAAYRDEYITTYPIASGTCDPGFCDSPLVNDFIGSKKTFNLDGNFSWNINDWLTATVEALNLTNQPDERWMYQASRIVTQYASTGRQVFVGLRARF
ncbi:MAG TPA: TonB-dependent receptor [Hyphomonadaceae bacterium]|nr:TonB-dependent receptor [Hyphomonadaceae bacterium]